jgi:DNA-binding NarL/FixJ family response regulator
VTRVLVVASSAVVRAGLESIVRSGPGLEVVGTASSPHALAESIESLQPDVVLVEVEPADTPSEPALPGVASGPGPPAFVVLGDDSTSDGLAEALRLGTRAVLPRDAQPREIIAAVEAAAAGLVILHPANVDSLLAMVPAASRVAPGPAMEALTPREIEVLAMLAEGEGNKQIARRLGISEHTVKFHVGSILAKLGAASRTEAVTLGVRQGLIMV